MILAAVDSTSYKIVLLLHILAVVVGFAPAWLTPALVRLRKAGDNGAAEQLQLSVLRYSLPGIALAGLFGFALSGMSNETYKMSQGWLSAAVAIWLVLLAVIVFVVRPAIAQFAKDAGDAARGRIMMGTGITHLLLVVMLYLMIFKPGV